MCHKGQFEKHFSRSLKTLASVCSQTEMVIFDHLESEIEDLNILSYAYYFSVVS